MSGTITFKAIKTGVEHDGVSMIVMNKGKETTAPSSAEALLTERGYVSDKGKVKRSAAPVDETLADAIARADAAEAKLAEGGSAESFKLGGYTLTEKGGGWFVIVKGDEEVEKLQGEDEAKAKLIELLVEDATAPDSSENKPV